MLIIGILHLLDILLWIAAAGSVAYVAVSALLSALRRPRARTAANTADTPRATFLVLFPAYKEDGVIVRSVESFMGQAYPRGLFRAVVIADQLQPPTIESLRRLGAEVIEPRFETSSKAAALRFAMRTAWHGEDYATVLDADNIVRPDFLARLCQCMAAGHRVAQCHRTAKNSAGDVARLDGLSEEINNSLFRRAPMRVGLSAAIIGSGVCFEAKLFAALADRLSTAGEDKEMTALLLLRRIHIHYEEDIDVYDEKVSRADNFGRQRQRWMRVQLQCLMAMLPRLPQALREANFDYINYTAQQALIPRSLLLVLCAAMSLLTTVLATWWCGKWWALFAVLCLSILLAVPRRLRTRAAFASLAAFPLLAWKMIAGLCHINLRDNTFTHTEHNPCA